MSWRDTLSQSISFPVPLDKGNEGSGNEIARCLEIGWNTVSRVWYITWRPWLLVFKIQWLSKCIQMNTPVLCIDQHGVFPPPLVTRTLCTSSPACGYSSPGECVPWSKAHIIISRFSKLISLLTLSLSRVLSSNWGRNLEFRFVKLSKTNSTTWKYCSIAFNWMVTH